ncbi:MAG: tRNA 2-thiouridine(34) synthase MnmA [Minisyncoccus archaeiphilus]|uniref:tRNA 2-thiouridine(34) synthase MnmA n=1 Tax=Minisyncoccus archaeiphilus TaxID=3238481 RepID=UPI002B06D541|nr:MAG: tRNA 2-thiouridine(34) synthase MnmA [Candidatus Parcubacteria bacterium]
MTKKDITVAVGMSGGVDSTMAALILKEKGYNVIGLTMTIWDNNPSIKGTKSGCYGPNEEKDVAEAKKAAILLGIKHHIIDLKEEYQTAVMDYFKNEYKKGKTPNPCVVCNAKIKFGILIEKALSSGIKFDYFATGHYVRVSKDKTTGLYVLKKGVDKSKDQSYFLYRLKQKQLAKLIFPLGTKKKVDVKNLATKKGFASYAEKAESQNFVECDSYASLLPKGKPGYIIDNNGVIIGKHEGITNYTVGQRKINVGGLKEPYYVLKIDAKNNSIIAGPKSLTYTDTAKVTDINWIIPLEIARSGNIQAKVRYGSELTKVEIEATPNKTLVIRFEKPQFAIAPGQSVVLYEKDKVIGGGIIY